MLLGRLYFGIVWRWESLRATRAPAVLDRIHRCRHLHLPGDADVCSGLVERSVQREYCVDQTARPTI